LKTNKVKGTIITNNKTAIVQ